MAAATTTSGIHTSCHAFSPLYSRPYITARTTTSSSIRIPHTFHSRLYVTTTQTPEEVSMTQDALSCIDQAIAAVNPYTAVQAHIQHQDTGVVMGNQTYMQEDYDQILMLSFGKASSAMSKAVVDRMRECMPELPIQGMVVCKDDHATQEEVSALQQYHITIQEASHPVPDERSVSGATKIVDLLRSQASERTLVVCCISGGGSALCCAPKPPLTLQDLQETNQALLQSGLSIQDMNVIRKRLETTKGGRLAAAAFPSTVVTLILSDILGDPLDLIASGPTVRDESTWSDAQQLLRQNHVLQTTLPPAVLKLLREGPNDSDDIPEQVFAKCKNVLVGNNELAVTAAADEAQRLGYNPVVLSSCIEGEAKHVAGVYTAMAQQLSLQRERDNVPYSMVSLPAAIFGGGETTVTLPTDNQGKGGRNQELALAAALQLKEWQLRNVVVASVGTDGTDGPTDAAGAVVDGSTVDRIDGDALEALQRHDAYNFFKDVDDGPLVIMGPTGTNVADVCVVLVK